MSDCCSLESIVAYDNLECAWRAVRANRGAPGVDGITIDRFEGLLDIHLLQLAEDVLAGQYVPQPVRFVDIVDGYKSRRLAILPVRDRVLQRAVLDCLGPRIDPFFHSSSFGYRPGRSLRDAVTRITQLRDRGLVHVVDADIRDCFGSLNHNVLVEALRQLVPNLNAGTRALIRQWIQMPGRASSSAMLQRPLSGILLGAPISPLLCNVYLHQMDMELARARAAHVRYADDFVILCRDAGEAGAMLDSLNQILGKIHLVTHSGKTRITSFDQGFAFLGVSFAGSAISYEVDGKQVTSEATIPDWFYPVPEGYS